MMNISDRHALGCGLSAILKTSTAIFWPSPLLDADAAASRQVLRGLIPGSAGPQTPINSPKLTPLVTSRVGVGRCPPDHLRRTQSRRRLGKVACRNRVQMKVTRVVRLSGLRVRSNRSTTVTPPVSGAVVQT